MATVTTTTTISSPPMDKLLLKAASSGNSESMNAMALQDPSILFGTTPEGNPCLHISSIHGHQGFSKEVVSLDESLLMTVNLDGETPLITAIRSGHLSMSSYLLRCCHPAIRQAILQQDIYGFNALHHAILNGHESLALELISKEPALSQAVSKCKESPLFFAVRRNFTHIYEKIMQNPDCAYLGGIHCYNSLHAAVMSGDQVLVKTMMEKNPALAREANVVYSRTPVRMVVHHGMVDMLGVMLEHDSTLGYEINSNGDSLLTDAAYRGQVVAAQEILKHCPDAPPYNKSNGQTLLHVAVQYDQVEFVGFVLNTPLLRKVVNMKDNEGKSALHYAVRECNPRLVAALLSHQDIHAPVLDNSGALAAWELLDITRDAKTLNWNEVFMLVSRACPQDDPILHNLHLDAKKMITEASRKDANQLTQTYTTSTSLVAILIATVTFVAAFTLPGGYSYGTGIEGLPVTSKRIAFIMFFVSDTLAMCSSFVVALICILARWEDLDFLIYYMPFTKKLMWFAYVATTTAFSTGLYTVLAPRLHSLAITICVMVALSPPFTWLLVKWHVLKLRFRWGKSFRFDFRKMV